MLVKSGHGFFQASYNIHLVLEICYTFGIPRIIMIWIACMPDDRVHQFDHLPSVMQFKLRVCEVYYMTHFSRSTGALQLIIHSSLQSP